MIVTYTGPTSGSWSTSTNWTPQVVPNNGGGFEYLVLIDGGNARRNCLVQLDSHRTVSYVEIADGDELRILNNQALTMAGGQIANSGVLSMDSAGNGTELRMGVSLLLGGDGEMLLSDNFWNIVRNNFGAVERLTNGANHTIRGAGQLGYDSLYLSNYGLIQANKTNWLHLNLRHEETNLNFGTMEAADGGTLNLFGSGTIDNHLGTLRAKDGSAVYIESTNIWRGELTTEGSGVISTISQSVPHLEEIHNTGNLRIRNNEFMAFSGTIENDATISMDSVGNGTDFRVVTPEVTLAGPGALLLSDNPWNVIRNNFGDVTRLVNDADHTIRGAGQLGYDSLYLTNNGLIRGDKSNSLHLNLRHEQTNYNNGTIEALDGGTVDIFASGTIDNSLGLLRAKNASAFYLRGTQILGGELTTEGSGFISTGSQDVPHLVDIRNTGNLRIRNNEFIAFSGEIDNDATISMDSFGNGTDFRVVSPIVTLTGPGELALSDNYWNVVRNSFGDVTRLVNDADHTIRGAGQLGYDSLYLTNWGLIQGDKSNSLHLNLRHEQTNFNYGTLEAASGGTLQLFASGTIDNQKGLIRAGNGSQVHLEATHILGGELTTEGSGVISTISQNVPHLEAVHSTGHLQIRNNEYMAFSGTIENDGTISMNSFGNGTDFRVVTDIVTLGGTGELALSDNFWNVVRNSFGGINRLVNDTDHTIRGSGQIGYDSIGVENRGAMIADSSSGMWIDPRDEAGGLLNKGSFHVTGAGSATFFWGLFENQGSVLVDAGRTLARYGDYWQTSGSTLINGSLTVNSGAVQLQGGSLGGLGTINSFVNNTGGTVAPAASAGTLTIQGNYTQGASGVLEIELAGPVSGVSADELVVSGTATLAGTLSVSTLGGYNPPPGSQFTILTAGSRVGTFALVQPCRFTVSY
ncbi:MAG: hypothetical protein FJ253_07270, partial [Phycisphaerae bacterium]|nr:hypothetical protein [Phycisphaerae bacterium]